jgi:hypothetical protein
MEKKYQLVPTSVENYIMSKYSFVPSSITFPLITNEGFETLSNMEKVWTTDYFYDKKLYSYEGLIKYKDSDMFIYYQKSESESTYKLVFLFRENSKDSVVFIVNSLTKFNVKNYENLNNTRVQE